MRSKPDSHAFDLLPSDGAQAVRDWIAERSWDVLHPAISAVPDWVLLTGGGLFALGTIWGTVQAGALGLRVLRRPRKALSDVLDPDREVNQVRETAHDNRARLATLEDRLLADNTAMRAQVNEVLTRLDELTTGAPLERQEAERRDEAAVELVAEQSPASQAAAEALAEGRMEDAFAIMDKDARAASADAAERWRRLGALAKSVDTKKARDAYEQAFKLQPDDFWTGIELSRLRREAGDLKGSGLAALAAQKAAQVDREHMGAWLEFGTVQVEAGDHAGAIKSFEGAWQASEGLVSSNPGSAAAQRDLSVSLIKLGDVLVAAGDLAGARQRYEASLEILEGLASSNSGSAEAQRDLSVSLEKLGEVLVAAGDLAGARQRYEASLEILEGLASSNPGSAAAQRDVWVSMWKLANMGAGVRWADVLARLEEMKARGVLLPADEPVLEEVRRLAAGESR